MEKKFVINRVDLGQRVTGYEVFNAAVNGGEVIALTTNRTVHCWAPRCPPTG